MQIERQTIADLLEGATHTLLRIFDAYGDRLSPEGWAICIKSVIFRLMSSIEEQLGAVSEQEVEEQDQVEWHDTAVVVIDGISGLLANYLDVLTVHPTFNSYWQQLLGHFASLLDFQVLEINTATLKALTRILAQSQNGAKQNFNKTTIDLAWDLWARGIPVSVSRPAGKFKVPDNQNCLLAYVAALRDVYRLIQFDMTLERVSRMLTLLREAMQQASPGPFVADIEYVTPLQGQILEVLKMLRADIAGVPSALVKQASEFVSLAFEEGVGTQQRTTQKRTYVAMSKASMLMLESFIVGHASDLDIYSSGAFLAALTSLSKPIVLKYQFTTMTKSVQPWKQATTSALAILGAALPALGSLGIPRSMLQAVWRMIVTIGNGITSADCDVPADRIHLYEDEEFDISCFNRLRELVIPWMGAEVVPDMTRKLYAESLFRISMIHAPAPAESALIYGNNTEGQGLATVYKARSGRTVDATPTYRQRMAYVCLDELFSLVMSHDEVSTPQITVQPPTPGFPPAGTLSSQKTGTESGHSLRVRLARTAAPYLILRTALTLRAYIADQPLRGRMPQPLSQRRELSRILERLVELKSESEAIPDCTNVESETRKHMLRLYPLIVDATRVAGCSGDAGIGALLGRALDIVGGELGM